MQLKIPKVLKLGLYPYTIKFSPDIALDNGEFGQINHRALEIVLWSGMPGIRQIATLLHEVLHAVDRSYHCHLEDEVVDRLAEGLADFLIDGLGIEFDWSEIDGNN